MHTRTSNVLLVAGAALALALALPVGAQTPKAPDGSLRTSPGGAAPAPGAGTVRDGSSNTILIGEQPKDPAKDRTAGKGEGKGKSDAKGAAKGAPSATSGTNGTTAQKGGDKGKSAEKGSK